METKAIESGLPKRVRVWNRGEKKFDYEVMGERYTIEPGKSIELPRRTAVAVRGFYPGKGIEVKLDIEPIAGDNETSIVPLANDKEKVVVYSCFKCDAEFPKKEELLAHVKKEHGPGRKPTVKNEG
jgi:hypothetical protein